jgi:hypothetical protein
VPDRRDGFFRSADGRIELTDAVRVAYVLARIWGEPSYWFGLTIAELIDANQHAAEMFKT